MPTRAGQELVKIVPPIIGICPRHRSPILVPKGQRDFCVDPIAQIDAMFPILGRSQYQLGEAQVARVDVHRAGRRRDHGKLSFQSVAETFAIRQIGGIARIAEESQLFLQPRSHTGVIVLGFNEIESRTEGGDRAPGLLELFPNRREMLQRGTKCGYEGNARRRLLDLTHGGEPSGAEGAMEKDGLGEEPGTE